MLAMLCDFAQGFDLMNKSSTEYGWDLNYGNIARIWRGGCIIRARLLEDICLAYKENDDLKNLLGGKGANLAEMSNLGFPVPPGFTITTEVCTYYYQNNNLHVYTCIV